MGPYPTGIVRLVLDEMFAAVIRPIRVTAAVCDGNPAFVLTVQTSSTCFGWERSVGDSDTRWNSPTNFRCYKDRVCYTQHPDAAACENPIGTTHKECRADTCSAGTMILSGAEDCPEAPVDGCPLSDQQEGSAKLTCDNPM
jgi:hypothetical protein